MSLGRAERHGVHASITERRRHLGKAFEQVVQCGGGSSQHYKDAGSRSGLRFWLLRDAWGQSLMG